jgi:hypothetical protein
MPDNLPGSDPKSIWQNQPTEASAMTMRLIQQKARELHAKTRRQLLGTLAAPLAAALFYATGARLFPSIQHVLLPPFLFALAWSLAGLYFLNRGMWSTVMPGDAGLSTGLEFCRREIERRTHLLRGLLLWSFAPILLATGTFIFGLALIGGRRIVPNGLPFLILFALWIVGYFVMRLREQRELQRELEDLNQIAGQNH